MYQRFQNRGNRAPVRPNIDLLYAIQASKMAKTAQVSQPLSDYVAKNTFNDFLICEQLKRNIAEKHFTSPMPIQDQAIPHILEGKDLIGIANTGTGKTAAFLIPLINKVFLNRNEKVLIITPTRELALQIQDEFRIYAKGMGMYCTLLIGGAGSFRQKQELRQSPNFVVGTPGRIKDFVQQRQLNLLHFHNIVLDEADRMVDIGFINDIRFFLSMLPKDRQSLFFSATISAKVKEILAAFVSNPVTVSVKQQDTSSNIEQDIVKVLDRSKKIDQLNTLLWQENFEKVLIFGRTKWSVQKLSDELIRRGHKAGAIHGNKNQGQRQRVLQQFKSDEIKILLATDVASRGLDINNVSHVINYDMPATYEDYIHRIGRTGRANKKGIALTFVD